MRRFIILGLVAVITVAVAGGVVFRSRNEASAYHNNQIQVGDINDDGRITFIGDVIPRAKIAFGLQPAPTPYLIPPTSTPTPLPVGGGHEQVLARDVFAEPGVSTAIGAIDPNVCPGAVFYLAARSMDASRSTYMAVTVNTLVQGRGPIQIDATGNVFLVHDFNGTGTSILQNNLNWGGINPTRVSVFPDAGAAIPVQLTLEVHCEPVFP